MNFRFIEMKDMDAFSQMAVDELMLDLSIKNRLPGIIRFFNFSPPAITIGRLQKIEEINTALCEKKNIDVVRRLTGGRAVIHLGDFTFSLVIRDDNPIFGGNVYKTYESVSLPFLYSLQAIDVPAKWVRKKSLSRSHNPLCFSSVSRYELTVNNKKILGVSQYRRKGIILIQGSLLLKPLPFDLRPFFNIEISTDSFTSLEKVGSVDINFTVFGSKLKETIKDLYNICFIEEELTEKEIKNLRIVKAKYLAEEWNLRK